MFKRAKSKADVKAAWMRKFEDAVVSLAPEHRGKVEWNTAEYYFGRLSNPLEAAEMYVEVRKVKEVQS